MAGREMEGKAGLHPGGRTGGLWAPGAGHSNRSPLVCGTSVHVGKADPRLLLGGTGVYPQGLSQRAHRYYGCSLGGLCTPHPGPDPTPWRSSPGPRPRPPGPPSHPRARCSAGGGIGWGRGAEAAAGTTSLPAASLCARGASGGGERASERRQRERGEASKRAGEGARRRPWLRSARLPATLLQRCTPCASSRRRGPFWLAWLPWGLVGQGPLIGDRGILGTTEGRGVRSGGHCAAALTGRTAWAGAWRGSGAPRGQRTPTLPGGAPTPRGVRSERAHGRAVLYVPPLLHKLFCRPRPWGSQ